MLSSKKLRSTLLFLFLNIVSACAFADSATQTLSGLLKNMHSMQANFTQTIVNKNGKAMQKSSGLMSLQRPSRFRWDVTGPIKQLIVTNGKRLWIYDPDLEQVTIRALVKAAGETPAMLLSDENLSLTSEFAVSAANNNASSLQWFLLIPKDKSSMIASLKLGFANGEIKEMQLRDHLGHNTIIQFSNVRLNTSLSASLFSFKPPAHVDVIDETKR